MPSNRATVLCRYHYDALNRVTASAPSAQASVQRFYLKDRLTTEIQGAVQRSIMQHEDQLLAQREHQTTAVQTHLLATDQQRSVLNLLDASVRHPLAYTPYGHRQNGLLSLLGFNGERRDPVTGSYLLGNGYRAFNPVLMRFNSPDSWSPFGEGGLNAYGYCVGDPVNRHDPTGHTWKWVKYVLRSTKLMRKKTPVVDLSSARPGAMPPFKGNQRPSDTSIGIEGISNDQTYLSGISKTEPLNITKEEAIEKISTLKELHKQTNGKIKELDKSSNDIGNTIATQQSIEENHLYGRRFDHETLPTDTLGLIYNRNKIRSMRIEHAKTLRNTESLIETYSRYT